MANLLDIEEDIRILRNDIRDYTDRSDRTRYNSGEICPKCKNVQSSTCTDSRIDKDGYRIRNRKCNLCGKKWRTIELLYNNHVKEYISQKGNI